MRLPTTGPVPSDVAVPAQVLVPDHATEQDFSSICRPLAASVVRMLAAVAAEFSVTEPRGAEPLLIRFTAWVTESPGTKLVVVTGTVTPGPVTSMSIVPDA